MKKIKRQEFFRAFPFIFSFAFLFFISPVFAAVTCEYTPRDSDGMTIGPGYAGYVEDPSSVAREWLVTVDSEEQCNSRCEASLRVCGENRPTHCDPRVSLCGIQSGSGEVCTCCNEERATTPMSRESCDEFCRLTPERQGTKTFGSTAYSCSPSSSSSTTTTPDQPGFIKPNLEIPLPTLPSLSGFTDVTLQGEAGSRYFWVPWIGQYIAAIYKYAIGIVGILSGIMIVVGGLLWLTAGGSAERVSTAKSFIESSLVGLVIALTSYLLLYAINPNLVGFEGLKVKYIEGVDAPIASPSSDLYEVTPAEGGSRAFISNEDFKAATGEDIPTREQITAAIPAIAEAKNIDVCFLQTIVAKETNYKANKIGHDEDVPRTQVGSRVSFINSGKKYSGATFTPSAALMTDRSIRNDDAFNPSAPPNYGLDVRFTHGIGLGQFTILRENGEMTRCSDGNIGRTFGGRCYNVLELLKMDTSIEVAADLIKTILTNRAEGNPERLFYYYAGSGCSARVSQCRKMKEYADCKGNSSLASRERDDCLSWLDENKDNCKNSEYR